MRRELVLSFHPQSAGLRLKAEGFSHGLTKCPPDTLYPPFGRVVLSNPISRTTIKKNLTQKGEVLFSGGAGGI